LIDLKFGSQRATGGGEFTRKDPEHAAIEPFTRPDHDHTPVGQGRDLRIFLVVFRMRADADIGLRGKRTVGGHESRINLLGAGFTALPDEDRAAVLQQSHLRIFLVAGGLDLGRGADHKI